MSIEPQTTDVLLGNAFDKKHPGNVKLNELLAKYHPLYTSNSIPISQRSYIIKQLEGELNDFGARFLEKKRGQWKEITGEQKREKTLELLKDFGSTTNATTTSLAIKPNGKQARPTVAPERETSEYKEVDILLGRGKRYRGHPGNIYFRQLVASRRLDYDATGTSKRRKGEISRAIMDQIDKAGGRFLEQKQGHWKPCSREKKLEKVSHALREQGVSFMVSEESPFSEKYKDIEIPTIPSEFLLKSEGEKDNKDYSPPTDIDCLFLRANIEKYTVNSEQFGNKFFEELLKKYQKDFDSGSVKVKADTVKKIIEEFEESGGRFLEARYGDWVRLTDKEKYNKVQMTLKKEGTEKSTKPPAKKKQKVEILPKAPQIEV